MPKLKPIRYDEFSRKLIRAGYVPIRKSKHMIYYHREKQITIPFPHKHTRDIPTGLIHRLIKEMNIAREEFERL